MRIVLVDMLILQKGNFCVLFYRVHPRQFRSFSLQNGSHAGPETPFHTMYRVHSPM